MMHFLSSSSLALAVAALAAADLDIVPDFPLYFDVGGCSSTDACMAVVETAAVERVVLNSAFECPHPCGEWPSYNSADGTTVNGGIPQLVNLSYHLEVLQQTFDKYQPNASDSRFVDLDYEDWSPIWERLGNTSWYHNASVALVASQNPSWDEEQLEAEAKAQWEASAQSLILATISFLRSIRPNLRIGLYNYPARYYYNGYETAYGDELRAQNDRLGPVWCALDALFVSVYQFYNGSASTGTEQANEEYVYANIAEARRIADQAANPASAYACGDDGSSGPLVLPYTWHRYHDGVHFLEDVDMAMFWKNGSAAGADGLVMWGSEQGDDNQAAFEAWYSEDFVPLINAWSPPSTPSPAA